MPLDSSVEVGVGLGVELEVGTGVGSGVELEVGTGVGSGVGNWPSAPSVQPPDTIWVAAMITMASHLFLGGFTE